MTEAAQSSEARRAAAGRRLAATGCLGLAGVLLACLAGLGWWLAHPPPPQPCPLPVLNIPRAGDLFAWSRDGKRLLVGNRLGEVWAVRFPDLAVEQFPRFSRSPWGLAWDAAGRPLVMFPVRYPLSGLARLSARGTGWDRLGEIGSEPVVSPDGRWVAALRGGPDRSRWQRIPLSPDGSAFSIVPPVARQVLTVTDLQTERMVREFRLPGARFYDLVWKSERSLVISGDPQFLPNRLEYRVGAKALQKLPAGSRPLRPAVEATYQADPIPQEWLLRRLRTWLASGSPPFGSADWSLKIRNARGKEIRRVPLGRRAQEWSANRRPWSHTWKTATVSPDGCYIVAKAADDTLRVLDLGSDHRPGAH